MLAVFSSPRRWQLPLTAGYGALLLLMACMMTACASPVTMAPALTIDGLRVVNRSSLPVRSVTIRVPASERFVTCGFIPVGAFCATTFPELVFSGNPVEIAWEQPTGEWMVGPVFLSVSDELLAAGRAQVEVVIAGPGSAGAMLLEE